MDQRPSVGRIVHYTPPQQDGVHSGKGQAYPATITHVWGDACVNLSVHNDGSFPLKAEELTPTSVSFGEGPRTWSWPPRV